MKTSARKNDEGRDKREERRGGGERGKGGLMDTETRLKFPLQLLMAHLSEMRKFVCDTHTFL